MITAAFTASFANFNAAVDGAQTKLKDFGTGAENVGATLNRMVDNFSGRKLIQQATEMAKAIEDVGGVTMLTDQELQKLGPTFEAAAQKMKALGMEVPPSFTAITDAAKDSEKSWEHLGETISKAFEDPIGALKDFGSAFSTSVVDELGAVGLVAAGAVTALAAVGVGLFELAERAASVGAAFNDMAESTGMSSVAASNLSTAVGLAGGSVENLNSAIFQMQKRMDDGGPAADKVAAAIQKLGINVDDFQKLDPDQKILALSEGFRNLGDNVSKAGIGNDIFGRQFRELIPTLMKPLDELVDKSKELGATWSNEETKAAEDFEIQVRELKLQLSLIGTTIGKEVLPYVSQLLGLFASLGSQTVGFVGRITGIAPALHAIGVEAAWAAAAFEVLTGKAPDLPSAYKNIATAADDAAAAQKKAADAAYDNARTPDKLRAAWQAANIPGAVKPGFDAIANLNTVTKDLDEQYKTVHKQALDDAAKATKDAADAEEKLNEQLIAIEGNAPKAAFSIVSTNDALASLGVKADIAEKALIPVFDRLNAIEGIAKPAAFSIQSTADALAHLGEHVDIPVFSVGAAQASTFDTIMNQLPATLERSISSGKDAIKSGGALIGKDLGASISDGINESIKDANFLATGVADGASGLMSGLLKMIPVVGSMLGPLLSKLFSIGGPSQAELAGRKMEAAFEQSFGGMQQMIDAVGAAYTATGKSAADAQADIKSLFDAEKGGGPAVQAAIDKITVSLDAQAKKTQDVATGVDAITSAAQVLGGTAPAALQPLVAQLEGLPGITDAEKTALDALLGNGTTDYGALTKMAEGYGITLEQLGPKFEQANISDRADQIVKDFQALSDAGADTGQVLGGMADEVSTLVDNAITYGSTLPTALKPIIENLQAAGLLTDATGKKLDDLSGLSFNDAGDPLAKGLQSLTDAINNLIKLLGGLPADAAAAAQGIGDNLSRVQVQPIKIPYGYEQVGDGLPSGGDAAEHHATGGIVGGFPGAPQGTDTIPAWLSAGERVLTVPEQATLAAQSSGPSNITIEVPVTVDGREIARVVTNYQSRDLQARRKLSAA